MKNRSTLIINDAAHKLMAWRIPNDFSPDCYISFDRVAAEENEWPSGTNLFHVDQAKEMLEYCIGESVRKEADLPKSKQLTIDDVWASDEIMALNVDLGLDIYALFQLVQAIQRAQQKLNAK